MSAAPQLAEELFNEHHRRIYLYCCASSARPRRRRTPVQATVSERLPSLNDGFEPEVAQAWLFKVAHNVCLTRQRSSYRRARVERPHDLQAVQDTIAAPEASGDELFGLDEALAGLPLTSSAARFSCASGRASPTGRWQPSWESPRRLSRR
jgi:DNA-directed RNA polymerase specialized sigma24 family protein